MLLEALIKNRYHKLDEHHWEDYIPPPLSKVATEAFQKRLNELAGVEPDGGPRLKLAWAPDCEQWHVYLKRNIPPEWALWKAVPDGLEPVSDGSIILRPKWRYVAVPRYAILGRVPPESRWGDTRDRSFFEADGTSVEEVEQPLVWKKIMMIFEHDTQDINGTPICCLRRAHDHRTKCFGRFRNPDDYDLKFVARKLSLSAKLFEAAPHERLTVTDRANVMSGRIDELAAEQAARDREADYISQSEDKTDYYKRLVDGPKNNYSIPGV